MRLSIFLGLAVAFLSLLGITAAAETIRMDQLAVEGEIHKPEVMFILERSQKGPPTPGVERLRSPLLDEIVKDAVKLAERDTRSTAQ